MAKYFLLPARAKISFRATLLAARLTFWMRAAESEILKLVASGLHQRALCGLNLSGGAQQIAVIVFLLISSSCVVSSKRGS
jgi:hypothetical protein